MRKNFAAAFFLCAVLCIDATTGFAQSRVNGKWSTDRPAEPQLLTEAQRKQGVQLQVTIMDAKASGSFTIGGLGGTFYTFEDGKVMGNKVEFRTGPEPSLPTWTIKMVDDNTVMLSRGSLPVTVGNNLDLTTVLPGFRESASPVQPVPAQASVTAAISGKVQDTTKAIIPGVTVTATNVDTGSELTTVTNSSGRYAFAAAIPGNYTLTASLQGFKTTTVTNLMIGDTHFLQDLTLALVKTQAAENPSATSCAERLGWCAMLHRAK